ncbi:MAG: ribonuclease P protein component [Verrucomicrobiales bacterium]
MKLTKARRMKTWGEFQAARQARNSRGGRFVVVSAVVAAERKFGFITSRKVGKAVVRNRVRRRLREIARKWGDALVPGMHVVTIARYTAGDAPLAELERDWVKQAKRLGIWRGEGGEGA